MVAIGAETSRYFFKHNRSFTCRKQTSRCNGALFSYAANAIQTEVCDYCLLCSAQSWLQMTRHLIERQTDKIKDEICEHEVGYCEERTTS